MAPCSKCGMMCANPPPIEFCETCIEGQMCQGCILKAVIGGLLIDWHCIERLVMPGWIGPGLASECWIGDVLV